MYISPLLISNVAIVTLWHDSQTSCPGAGALNYIISLKKSLSSPNSQGLAPKHWFPWSSLIRAKNSCQILESSMRVKEIRYHTWRFFSANHIVWILIIPLLWRNVSSAGVVPSRFAHVCPERVMDARRSFPRILFMTPNRSTRRSKRSILRTGN